MSVKNSEKTTKLTCTEHIFSEFPDLLYGTTTDGITYIDATSYLQTKNHKTIEDFWTQYRCPIESLLSENSIELKDAFVTNQDDHVLIILDLVFLFLSFVEPGFISYVCDRINELFTDGFSVSDTYLFRMSSERLSNKILKTIIDERQT